MNETAPAELPHTSSRVAVTKPLTHREYLPRSASATKEMSVLRRSNWNDEFSWTARSPVLGALVGYKKGVLRMVANAIEVVRRLHTTVVTQIPS